jgi:hypothetical protein
LGAQFVVRFDAVRLSDCEIQIQGGLFYGGSDEFEAASFGAVRLSDDKVDAVTCSGEFFQRRDGEARGAAEDERERHFVILQSSNLVI